jgi:hypothetical protein
VILCDQANLDQEQLQPLRAAIENCSFLRTDPIQLFLIQLLRNPIKKV